jgi:hypothetical protein
VRKLLYVNTEAEKGKRVELGPGWSFRTHREEFNERREEILSAIERQLKSFRFLLLKCLTNEKKLDLKQQLCTKFRTFPKYQSVLKT